MLPAPLQAWAEDGVYNGPVLLLGRGDGEWVGVCDDGRLRTFPEEQLTVEWRFDWRSHEWIEVSGVGEAESPDDGSADLQGSVLDPDGAGEGDQVDEEGGPATGDPGDVDTGENILSATDEDERG
jgi:hypothetical protein